MKIIGDTTKRYTIFRNETRISQKPSEFNLESDSEQYPTVYSTFRTLDDSEPQKDNQKNSKLSSRVLVPFLHYHIERLLSDASALGILRKPQKEHDFSWLLAAIKKEVRDFGKSLPGKTLRGRLILSPEGAECFLDTYRSPWILSSGIQLKSILAIRSQPKHKTTHLQVSKNARAKALKDNKEEALLIDENQFVYEGAFSNIFWFDKNGILHTPKDNILPGIIRRAILEITEGQLSNVTLPSLLKEASEIFVTQSTSGITPVLTIDDCAISSSIGEHTQKLRKKFQEYQERHAC